jgi:RNA polymerase sigma-70 factor (ECF subfamily)
MTLSERKLIEQATQGDAIAIDALVAEHLPRLRAYLRLRVGREILERESIDDLAQSVCLELLQNMDRFQYGGARGFRRWLYTSAQRKIADRHAYLHAKKRDVAREQKAAADAQLLECYASFCTPSRHAAAREELEHVERIFAELAPEQREVIVLAKIVGLSRKEIGEEMGKSEGAVRVLLSRALATLAARLAP